MKEKLLKYGISEELVTKIVEDFKDYIPNEKLKEVMVERDKLKEELTTRDAQLEELKKNTTDVENLKLQIEELQNENKSKKEEYDKELYNIKLNNAVEHAIKDSKGKNIKAIKSLLDFEKIKLNDDGSVDISDQIKKLIETDEYMFETKNNTFRGVKPTESNDIVKEITKENFDKMSYKERINLYNENKELYNQLNV